MGTETAQIKAAIVPMATPKKAILLRLSASSYFLRMSSSILS